MSGDPTFEDINETKADMDYIYNEFDPRSYFRELKKLDYSIPGIAKPIFQELINHLQKRNNDTIHILDLGCSYGINAALLKHDLSMNALNEHWGQKKMTSATPEKVIEYDRQYFAGLETSEDIKVIGLDQAKNAIEYGVSTGLLDEGIVINLETEQLSALERDKLATINLVTSTGCVGYLTEKSFEHLLPVITEDHQPWIANFVLRLFPFDTISKSLDKWGYVTEKLEGQTFFQRKFASDDEQKQVLRQLRDQGVDPTDKESEGHFLAEFYLSRPMKDAADMPIKNLLPS